MREFLCISFRSGNPSNSLSISLSLSFLGTLQRLASVAETAGCAVWHEPAALSRTAIKRSEVVGIKYEKYALGSFPRDGGKEGNEMKAQDGGGKRGDRINAVFCEGNKGDGGQVMLLNSIHSLYRSIFVFVVSFYLIFFKL